MHGKKEFLDSAIFSRTTSQIQIYPDYITHLGRGLWA